MEKRWKKIIANILIVIMVCNCFHAAVGVSFASGVTGNTDTNVKTSTEMVEKNDNNSTDDNTTVESITQNQENTVENKEKTSKNSSDSTDEYTGEESVFSDEMINLYFASSVPTTIDELNNTQTKEFNIKTYEDVLALQELSQVSSLEGYTFIFGQFNNTEKVWDLTSNQFTGFGNEEFPFKGTLREDYSSGVTFKMKRTMFQYLGSGATIENFSILLDGATSGIAQNFIIEDTKPVTYNNITLTQNQGISNPDGTAGALYGTVENKTDNQYTIELSDNGINVSGLTVSGKIAGGYIGEVKGNVKLIVSSGSNVASVVKSDVTDGSAAGGIVGKLGDGSSLEIASEITIKNEVKDAESVGGLVGICEGATIISNNKVTKETNLAGKVNVGGFVGLITDNVNNADVEISHFILNANVKARNQSDSFAGGVVGKYSSENGSLILSNIGVNKSQIGAGYKDDRGKSCGAGGVIGDLQGNNVSISMINDNGDYAFLPNLMYHGYNDTISNDFLASSATGGIAGKIHGQNINISDVRISFIPYRGISGYCSGAIFGYVKENSKANLSNITVVKNYVQNEPEYNGGIAGYVDKGCVIALCGEINLSKVSYKNDGAGVYGKNKGYVVGGQTESIIYMEQNANLIKNDNAANWKDDSVWRSDYYDNDQNYTLDDVGNYGGIYRNIQDKDGNWVIQYGNAYGQEINGIVQCTGGKYQLNGSADALRLAIALNTFDAENLDYELRFAKNCFQTGETGKTLLAADYCVTSDLDFSQAGIYSLCRNDSIEYQFSGSMEGVLDNGTLPVISLCIASKQEYAGLFPAIKGASFKNLKLSGYLYYAKNFGGIASYAEGAVTLDNIQTDMNMRANSYSEKYDNNKIYYYGGFIGQYNLQNNTFTCTNCVVAPVIDNIRVQQIAGGMVGYINTGKNAVTANNIIVTENQISSQMIADTNFLNNYDNKIAQARMAGMFAYIGFDVAGNQDDSTILGGSCEDATYAKINLSNITVDGAKIDLSSVTFNKENIRACGGLLGYDWNNVEVSVEDSLTVENQSVINSLGHVGGLLTILAGKMDFNAKVSLDSMEMYAKTDSQTFSGLLLGDGRYAVVTLKDSDYNIASSVVVDGYSDFDEIVGVNYALSDNNINNNACALSENYSEGGIVNIIKPEFANMAEDTYQSYQNKLVSQTNKYTRYYYNLFDPEYDIKKITVAGSSAVLDDSHKLMLWHLYKYMNPNIQRFIAQYFINESNAVTSADSVNTWTLSGNLDMHGYSFYPTKVSGGTYIAANGTVLKLYGEVIENNELQNELETNQKVPSSSSKQHYMMHAGLFYNASDVTVEGMTLQGTATYLADKSGVLFAGNLGGSNTIKNVTCAGIRLANYSSAQQDVAAGLLVAIVDDGAELNLDGISTNGYTGDELAAAALVGTVGGENSVNVHINFSNMKVEDDKGKVFQHASFIYYYDSVVNSDINKSFGLYTFTQQDFVNNNVTFGSELSYGVDYADKEGDSELDTIINNAKNGCFNPYVYKVKKIFVNPRNGNLDTGCGTYEDPYIITNERQFLTLYCYLTGSDSYKDVFEVVDSSTHKKWSVNPIGGGSDDKRCNATESSLHTSIEFGEEGFPSRDELRTAYYLIKDDLDLSSDNLDLNFYVISTDFSGLGTREFPFSGVIVGKKTDSNGTPVAPTITLPTLEETRVCEYYGLIQYMKGAVVKDLTIQIGNIVGSEPVINVSKSAGGVAAVALGGDNIIDNVGVNLKFTVKDTDTITGGYVGCVKNGSVVVRNMEKDDVEKYEVGYVNDGSRTIIDAEAQINYKRNARVIGWVEDGCVVYEGNNMNTTSIVLEQINFGFGENDIRLSYSFPIVNGNYLSAQCPSNNKIQIDGDSTNGFNITMNNAAQMEIAALALNSDAFSIYNSGTKDTNHANGYDYTARCRKAQYNSLGIKDSDDYNVAISEDDDNGYYPYLYKYMDFSGVTTTGSIGNYQGTQKIATNKRISLLNWSDGSAMYGNTSIGDIVTTYQLVDGVQYDLSGYGRSFRGFGSLYHETINETTYAYSQFKANFDGKNALVSVSMIRDWDSSIPTTGLFNDLTTYRANGFSISNIQIVDSRFDSTATTASSTGAIAGYVKGGWTFNNLSFKVNSSTETGSNIVEGSSYTGGLVGCINYYETDEGTSKQRIQFNECKIVGKETLKCNIKGSEQIGGLVGYVEGRTDDIRSFFGKISFENCVVKNSDISTITLNNTVQTGNVGGFVGRVGDLNDNTYNLQTEIVPSVGTISIVQTDNNLVAIDNVTVWSDYEGESNSVGGLVGIYSAWGIWNNQTGVRDAIDVSGIRINGLKTETLSPCTSTYGQYYGVGGLFGGIWCRNKSIVTIKDVQVNSSQIGTRKSGNLSSKHCLSTGGLMGIIYAYKLTVSGARVENSDIKTFSRYAGGFIGESKVSGESESNLTISKFTSANNQDGIDNLVNNTTVNSNSYQAGGLIGYTSVICTRWNISDVNILESDISGYVRSAQDDNVTIENGCAGGIVGRIHQDGGIRYTTLSNIRVGNATCISGNYAGGLMGYVGGDNSVRNIIMNGVIWVGCNMQADGTVCEDTSYTNIFGTRRAGGLFGYATNWGTDKSSADIQIQKTKIGAYATDDKACAGGIAGERVFHGDGTTTYNFIMYDKVVIKDCLIVANYSNKDDIQIACGGLYGYISNTPNNKNFAKVQFYNPKLTDNSIGYAKDMTSLDTLKSLQSSSENIHLLTSQSVGEDWTKLTINESTIGQYALRIGNYVGNYTLTVSSKKHFYILRPELTYSDNFTGSRPVIDVGNDSIGTTTYTTPYGYGYPYAWRTNFHIVYYEPDSSQAASSIIDVTSLLESGENEYLYSTIDSKVSEYQSSTTGKDFLDAYNLNVSLRNGNILNFYEKCVQNKTLNGVSVVYADGGSAQDILDSVIAILTNVGGIYEDPTSQYMTTSFLQVSAQKAKITKDGKIIADVRNTQSIVVNNNAISYQELTYDGICEDESYTITLLSFRYGWTGVDGQNRYETIYVPVFVVERIAFYSDLHIMEGEQYSLKDAHDSNISYSGNVTVAHDSTYTLFAELAYGEARKKTAYQGPDYTVVKTLTFQKATDRKPSGEYIWGKASIPEGMQFTLVDVETGEPYYYKVSGDNVTEIDFTAFKNSQNASYQNRQLGSIVNSTTSYQYRGQDLSGYDFGLEQFFIYVDSSNVEEPENTIFKISVTTEKTSQKALTFLDRTEYDGIEVTWRDGLSISFYEKGTEGRTCVKGENISKDNSIQIDTSIQINANQTYWDEKSAAGNTFIDSENNDKYLDVAIYLYDRNSGEYVTLPANTNIIMNGQRIAVVDKSVIYCYKDWGNVFPIGSVTGNMIGTANIQLENGKTVSNECHIELDFSTADIDDYVDKDYDIYLELRRSSSPDYPLGGDKLDTHSKTVKCIGNKEMAVALNVNDFMNLGINTYQETTSNYEIPFTTKLDFANMISNDKETDIQSCANKNYLITYRLKKKIKLSDGTYQYVSVGKNDSTSSLILGNQLQVKLNNQDGVNDNLALSSYNGEQVYQMEKTFSEDEIKNGLDGVPYVVSWGVTLYVNTENVPNTDFSNYMVEVTVLPFDKDSSKPDKDDASKLVDYFIFTVAKLKTDM